MDVEFEQLYNVYYMQVYSFVVARLKKRDVSEEITQKTFFKALSSGKKYRGGSSELTWLCAIAKNLLADEYRANKYIGDAADDVSSNTDIEAKLTDEDSAFRIHQVLHKLEEPYKEVFQLRVFGEMSFQRIGILFEKTENWARVTYHRARLKIQERTDRK